jgi:valyl-tRNA synthetase
MDKTYDHKRLEPQIYEKWEEAGVFSPDKSVELRKKANLRVKNETFCVLMPPPNANAPLHCGHATYAIQDLMARFKRMQGYKTLYVPGTDHAGFETQVVYERRLKEQGKSRFDFDRETLYNDILNFVKQNSDIAINQLKKLGMSADWSRNLFMLDDFVVETTYNTFIKMHDEGFICRDDYMVNYSPLHGTTFSNLETTHIEKTSPLFYVKYKIKDSNDFIAIATTRPETIYADVAIAVNPKDPRYKEYVGKIAINPLNDREMKIIADEYVGIEFGTGALKITPAHDFNDYEIGKKHNLEATSVIDLDGKMTKDALDVAGMTVEEARKKSVEILKEKGALEKTDETYKNSVLVDYKDKKPIEPMLLSNWFVKMEGLSKAAIQVIEKGEVKFNLPTWKKEILRWLSEIRDWPISRQTVFGIRIPAWYDIHSNDLFVVFIDSKNISHEGSVRELLREFSLDEIKSGLQKIIAPKDAKYVISKASPGEDFIQETDTFDTWFSSGQWPLTTLGYPNGCDFKEYFPTDFMDSMWDIIFFWIARMIMFSLYLTGQVPFKSVYIHGRITDERGQKMSKSKGNAIDPIEYVEKYGADALRMGILVGGNTAAKDISLGESKVAGYRNFSNKIWNMARFINLLIEDNSVVYTGEKPESTNSDDVDILNKVGILAKSVTKNLDKLRFKDAGDEIYHFVWHELADKYLERVKTREDKKIALETLIYVFALCLKLLHPFMPFVTEAVWGQIQKSPEETDLLVLSNWPERY